VRHSPHVFIEVVGAPDDDNPNSEVNTKCQDYLHVVAPNAAQLPSNVSHAANSSSNAFASLRSRVSKPSVKPPVDRGEYFAGLLRLALKPPEAHDTHCSAQFIELCLLCSRYGERPLEIPSESRLSIGQQLASEVITEP